LPIIIGIATGLPLGIPVGLILGNIALGPALGLPLGLVIGMIMEKKLNPNPIEPTKEEEKRQKRWLWVSVLSGLVVLVVLIEIYLRNK
jgi:hypothetical protein